MSKSSKPVKADLIPAVAYLRMSDETQSLSPEQQRREVEQYAERNGYRILRWYCDEAKSASRGQEGDERRVQYQRLLIDSNKLEFKAVLCWATSRFTRNHPHEAAQGKRILKANGVCLVTVKEGVIDWGTFEGMLKDTLFTLLDHKYSLDLGRDSLRGRRNTFLAGGYPYGQIPYGYNHLYINGTQQREVKRGEQTKNLRGWIHSLAVVETEAEVVRRIFKLFVESDQSLCAIARTLNQEGVPGPDSARKRSRALNGQARMWTVQNVRQRLATAAYVRISRIGSPKGSRHAHNKIEAEERLGDWPAIVSRTLWDAAQRKLSGNKGQAHEGRSGALQGILRCGTCGQVLHKENPRRKGDPRGDKYRCGSKARGLPGRCKRWTCYEADLLPRIAEEVVRALDEESVRLLEARPADTSRVSNQEVLSAHLASLEERISQAADSFLDRKLSRPMRDALEAKVEQLTAEATETRKRLDTLQATEQKGGLERWVEWYESERGNLLLMTSGGMARVEDSVLIEAPGPDGEWQPVGSFLYAGGQEGAIFADPKRYTVFREDGEAPPAVVDPCKLRALLKRLDTTVKVFWRKVKPGEQQARKRGRATTWVVDEARLRVRINCGESDEGSASIDQITAIQVDRVFQL